MRAGNESAASGVGARRGGENRKALGGAFEDQNYRTMPVLSIPSPEKTGCLARVVRRGDRLFVANYYAGDFQ